jgi:hypothetical protein
MFNFIKYKTCVSKSDTYKLLFSLKEHLKNNGWIVKMSGSGYLGSYSDSSDIILSELMMGNNNAWFVVKNNFSDNVNREILFEWNNTNKQINIFYSRSGLFSGGNNDTIPSATDRQTVYINQNIFTDGYTGQYFIAAGDISEGFSFYVFMLNNIYPYQSLGLLSFEKLENTSVLDVEPYIFWKSNSLLRNNITLTSNIIGYFNYGYSSQVWSNMSSFYFSSFESGIENSGITPLGKNNIYPIPIGRGSGYSSSKGIKGYSRIIKWHSNDDTRKPYTSSLNTFQDHLAIDDVLILWDNSGIIK